MDQAKDDLKELGQNQNDAALMMAAIQADVETLRLTLVAIAPGFAENLGKAFSGES